MKLLLRLLTLGLWSVVPLVFFSCGTMASDLEDRPGPPPGTYTITPQSNVIRIPFEMFGDDIRMNAHLNGKDIRMLIDNGSLWDQLLFFGSNRVDALAIRPSGSIDVGGAGSGDAQKSTYAEGLSIAFRGIDGHVLEFQNQEAVITPHDTEQPNPWEGTEGQVSANFFKHFVVGIDFDTMVITLTRPQEFSPSRLDVEIPMTPAQRGSWTIPSVLALEDGRVLQTDITMDLGWNKPLGITTGESLAITPPQNAARTVLGQGMQGDIVGYRGKVPGFQIGGYWLQELDATFAARKDGGSSHEVIVGMGLFRRFNITFDYQGHRVFIRPNKSYDGLPQQ